jgi:hypothetical protein
MTVISTLITRHCTVHSSDSLIIRVEKNGTCTPVEWEKSKIVPVRHFRGAMSYWGLAQYDLYNWSTFDWLTEQIQHAENCNSAEAFAYSLGEKLNTELSKMTFLKPIHSGIGIHFTAYEHFKNYWIPELFLISNWVDPSYTSIRDSGVGISRETYHTLNNKLPEPIHREEKYRLEVHEYLYKRSGMFIYNNGDPIMFNPAANAVLNFFRELSRRGLISNPDDINTHLSIARRPIEIVIKAQADFCKKDKTIIGGKPHDLAVTPNGEYKSSTGDGP